jgi:hypothetical protein
MEEFGKDGQSCPFAFNFDPQTFKVWRHCQLSNS